MSRSLVLERLHPLNLPLAWLWRRFARVLYWRTERLGSKWTRGFHALHAEDHFSLDEWQVEVERAFVRWRARSMEESRNAATNVRVLGVQVDYSGAWKQWIAMRFEERCLFEVLLAKWAAKQTDAVFTPGCLIRELEIPAPGLPSTVRRARGFDTLDRAWLAAQALGASLKHLIALFRKVGSIGAEKLRPLLWTGISASEVPDAKQRLDFAFLVERGLLDAKDCLFMLPAKPSDRAAARLHSLGIAWSTVSSFGFLPLSEKARALSAQLLSLLKAILSLTSAKRAILTQLAAESIPWIAAARTLRARVYLTSVSACWPERPEVAALSAMGLRTINWSYGANTFLYAQSDSQFRDLGMSRSISIASEVWVWTPLVERWLRARTLGEPPVIRVIGPVMCGDSRWLERDPQSARSALGIRLSAGQRLLAVFDVPAIRRELRHGPTMYPVSMLECFFRDVEVLLERMPELALLVKPKRALSDHRRDFPDSLHRIVDTTSDWYRSGRIVAVPHDIDPYIPVAVADICVGIPFTSPVLVAHHAGRHALFHDPVGLVNYVPGAPELKSFVTHGGTDLIERVQRLLSSPSLGCRSEDPALHFTQRLRQSFEPNARP